MTVIARIALALALLLGATQTASAALSNSIFSYSHDFLYTTELELTSSSGTVTQQYLDRGWYNQNGFAQPTNFNYFAGFNGSSDINFGDDLDYRNWFLYFIPQLTNDFYTAATLKLYVPIPDGYVSPQPSLTYTNFDVTTSLTALASGAGGVPAYVDLGTGTVFGSIVATDASEGTILSISLNAAALASINAAQNAQWGIGGAVEAVPEPSSITLAVLAASGLIVVARSRLRARSR